MTSTNELYAIPRSISDPEQCHFYHRMEIPGFGLTPDTQWDLRGAEKEYLGGVDLAGKRVLEIGPASGYMTFWMESQGAEVVSVELGPDTDWNIVPEARMDIESYSKKRREGMECLRNGYWFAHERMKSKAKVWYGDVHQLPAELGRFDIATMCSVLLHVRDPLHVFEKCASLAETLVVTDMFYPDLSVDQAIMALFSTPEVPSADVWWRFSPRLFERYGDLMGYQTNALTYHSQSYVAEGTPRPAEMYTVVSTDRNH